MHTEANTQVCMSMFVHFHVIYVYGGVSTEVREIVASEPRDECRLAITHGRGVGLSN